MTPAMAMAVLATAMLPVIANGQTASAGRNVELRAGPDTTYPLVQVVPGGTVLNVVGCVADYRWCDVYTAQRRIRGWAWSDDLLYSYENSPTSLARVGPASGVPVIGFTQRDYWGSFYRGLPFFRNSGNPGTPSPYPAQRGSVQ